MLFNVMMKTLNLELVLMSEYQNTQIFLQESTLESVINWSEVFVVRIVRNAVPWAYVISDRN